MTDTPQSGREPVILCLICQKPADDTNPLDGPEGGYFLCGDEACSREAAAMSREYGGWAVEDPRIR